VEWEYEPCDHWGPVDEVTVDVNGQGNHIEWVFEHGYNPYDPGTGGGGGQGGGGTFSVDFEGGMPAGWTTIDADGDGYNWVLGSNVGGIYLVAGASLAGTGHNASGDMICSGSYSNATYAALTPDNYLVSPAVSISNGSTFSFWACAQDASYAAEHFGVFVSDNGTSNWTAVQEWTMTAKNGGGVMSYGRNGNNRAQGSWHQYTVDLSAFAGTRYIAIRHFNCTDMFILDVDDIELSNGAKGGQSFTTGGEFYTQYAEDGIMLNFLAIDNVDLRAFLLYNISKEARFSLVPEEAYGQFILTSNGGNNLMGEFETVYQNSIADFSMLTKNDILRQLDEWKTGINPQYYISINMDVILGNSRSDNDHCALSMPFCTSDYIEFEAASTDQTAEQLEGQNFEDGCIGSSYNPSWYHMRIHTAGQFVIHLEGHDPINPSTERDVDFCIWGPFTDPVSPCVSQLTLDKIIDCSYSASYSEDIYLGYPENQHDHGYASHGTVNYHVPEVGEYYILMLTNFSRQPCVITFTKTEGDGETDCDIVNPTTDIIGFLITQDGEYLAFVGPDVREYTDIDEFGDHEYCVRPIYPGDMILPDHNYGWSMGCPVCGGNTGTCAPGANVYAEALTATDQVKVWWGDQDPGPGGLEGDEFSVNFESGIPAGWTTVDADGDGYNWNLASTTMGTGYGHNGSSDMVFSQSYDNNFGALTPDNWLVTPALTLGESSIFSFWACAQDASWASEHFGVAVSEDGGNTFLMVQEWTMTAKGERYDGPRGMRDQGAWHQYTVNLGDYAGEGRKVAIRHFNCTDMFYIDVDDIELSNGAKTRAGIVNYNVYRSTSANGEYSVIAVVPAVEGQTYYEYIDTPESIGTYYYQVTADYGDCESDPALSGIDPTVNYVFASVDALDENSGKVSIFPNPTSGNVKILANDMTHITVVSVIGQVVYDADVNGNEIELNMGQYNAGVYMVRIATENGVSTQRVTVVK
jgi:hypothetical protein